MELLEKEWFIEAPWGRISIIAWGNCYDPPVLLCHGLIDSAACFRPLIRLLPQKFYYIGIELPGNGKSDPFPRGMVLTLYDFVYAVHVVVNHFRWEKFIGIAHSFGSSVVKIYNLCYPGKLTKIIEFDPALYRMVTLGDFHDWYQVTFGDFFKNFNEYNIDIEKTMKVSKDEAIQRSMKRRQLSEKYAKETLERISIPAGDGFVRYTYDRRLKVIQTPPYTPEHYKDVLTSVKTPTLSIIAQDTIDFGIYEQTPFLLDETAYPNGNCRIKIVKGSHDVHYNNPECIADYVTEFLIGGFKAKL
ncbi:unnamed protein product [Pieris macdunnoughi]|uniref:AB hydrolase-1 domain-containing protein n=1 Tax=Pieris macdunnoughi TaxID=345717 RepID=A0A821XMU1_9NEOP|nr:unnamed protein product [Pieris macdunnoughi]